MGLLDTLATAQGVASANYLRAIPQDDDFIPDTDAKARTVIKISRVTFREPNEEKTTYAFRVDGEILGSTNPRHQAEVGFTGTMNLGFRYAKEDLAKMRRALSAAGTSLGIGKGADGKMTEAEAAERRLELLGEAQPLVGAIVTVVTSVKKGKKFTHYEVEVPSASDLALLGDETVAAE